MSRMQIGFTSSKDSKRDGSNGNSFCTYKDTYCSSGHSHFFTGTRMWLCAILGSRVRGQRTSPEMKQRNILQTNLINVVSPEFIQICTCHLTTLYRDKKMGGGVFTFFYPVFQKHLSYSTTSACGFRYFTVCQISYQN